MNQVHIGSIPIGHPGFGRHPAGRGSCLENSRVTARQGSSPLPSALLAHLIDEAPDGSMVKRISSLASNEKFQVRFQVELLKGYLKEQTEWRREFPSTIWGYPIC